MWGVKSLAVLILHKYGDRIVGNIKEERGKRCPNNHAIAQ
jgi:hypothetical protein